MNKFKKFFNRDNLFKIGMCAFITIGGVIYALELPMGLSIFWIAMGVGGLVLDEIAKEKTEEAQESKQDGNEEPEILDEDELPLEEAAGLFASLTLILCVSDLISQQEKSSVIITPEEDKTEILVDSPNSFVRHKGANNEKEALINRACILMSYFMGNPFAVANKDLTVLDEIAETIEAGSDIPDELVEYYGLKLAEIENQIFAEQERDDDMARGLNRNE